MDFYYFSPSPPCRAALLVARAVGIQLNLKVVNLMLGEHLTPDYIKLNPQHTIPTLDDDGFVLTESRAIMEYFVDKYAKDDSLCPKDPKKRAKVHQMLFFDATTLFKRAFDYFDSTLTGDPSHRTTTVISKSPALQKREPPSPESLEKLEEGLGFFNSFLQGQSWATGDDITIADYTLAVTVSTVEALAVNISKYPNVDIWYTKAKTAIPGFDEINGPGVQLFKELYSSVMKKNSNN